MEFWQYIAENISWIAPLISVTLSLIASTVLLICRNSKNKRGEKAAKTALSIIDFAQKAVVAAEQFLNFSGPEKKAFAVTQIKEWCIDSKLNYSGEQISDAIEKVIEISKNVNKR